MKNIDIITSSKWNQNGWFNGYIWENIEHNKQRIEALGKNDLVRYYITRFEQYFSSLWYEQKQWLKLVWEDDTILFTNSAIVSLKKYILNWLQIPNYFITQPCIRLQNLNNASHQEALYMSSFHMIWAFVSVEKYNDFIQQVWKFLLEELEYTPSELKIYWDKSHSYLLDWWEKLENWPEIVYYDEWFDWKFWEGDRMKWHGFDFRVIWKNWEYVDIGNIMEIISDGKVVWYWLWIGIETMISKKRNYINPIQFFTDNCGIKLERNEDIYLYDFLKILIDVYRNWLQSGRNSSWYEIKKTFHKINWLLKWDLRKYMNLQKEISLLENLIYWDILVSKVIYDELMSRSDYQVYNKPFTLVLQWCDDESIILANLAVSYPDIHFEIKDIYKWENIWSCNKSVTINMTYVTQKSKSKDYFKYILEEIWRIYNIR